MDRGHIITLRQPWEQSPGPGDGTDAATFVRRFGRPTQSLDDQRVWLVVEGCRRLRSIALNGQPLGGVALSADACHRFDVTGLLRARNVLTIAIVPSQDRPNTLQPVVQPANKVPPRARRPELPFDRVYLEFCQR